MYPTYVKNLWPYVGKKNGVLIYVRNLPWNLEKNKCKTKNFILRKKDGKITIVSIYALNYHKQNLTVFFPISSWVCSGRGLILTNSNRIPSLYFNKCRSSTFPPNLRWYFAIVPQMHRYKYPLKKKFAYDFFVHKIYPRIDLLWISCSLLTNLINVENAPFI